MRIRIIISLVVVALFSFIEATPTQALTIIDQQNESLDSNVGTQQELQQGITAGMCGELDSIDLYFHWRQGEAEVVLNLYEGAPWQSDVFYTTTFTPNTSEWTNVSLSSAGLNLANGDEFTIGLYVGGESDYVWVTMTTSDEYAGGMLWFMGTNSHPTWDINFRTYMTECTVPEPTTVALLGIGLVGLIGGAARKKLKKKAIAKT